MSEKNKKDSEEKDHNKGEKHSRHTLAKIVAAGSVGLTAFGITELALHSPSFRDDEQSQIVEHDFTPAHWIDDSYGKFSIPDRVPDKYQLKVKQHEPGMIGADNKGNVTFEVTVNQETYNKVKDGETVDHLSGSTY
jgi:hypothetical protein